MDGDTNVLVGGAASPYRLADFINYLHTALPPVHDFSVPSQVAKTGTITGMCSYNPTSSDKTGPGSVYFGDIGAVGNTGNTTLDDYYFGMYIVKNIGNTNGWRVTSAKKATYMAEFKASALDVGTYYVYPFLSSSPQPQYDVDMAAVYYTVPSTSVQTVRIVASLVTINIEAFLNKERTSIGVTVRITSRLGTSHNFTNNSVQCRFSEHDMGDPIYNGEYIDKVPDITVANNETKIATRVIFDVSKYPDKSYKIFATFDTGSYTGWVSPMMEAPYQ